MASVWSVWLIMRGCWAQDIHARFRTEAHNDVVARFNERFLLSLASCESCLVVDDELNVLPISQHARKLAPIDAAGDEGDEVVEASAVHLTPAQKELSALKESIAHTPLVGALAKLTKTLDQARTILTCADVLAEKSLRGIVAVTAGRGRVRPSCVSFAVQVATLREPPVLCGEFPGQVGRVRPQHRCGCRVRVQQHFRDGAASGKLENRV
jgi:N-acetyltransferase 10